ncbi:tetratricopeptide repeat protein [Camelimonas lactis]|uniref:Ancillary SecYEG translocon subunit/Cell division coordinator CpoB TPR domain-containing protein n=1 Tax=Camelimonas lactis TaxID=659006 RepID=A0A4R2GXD9_9HYPH|nr:tetratricopeptide repeat protein [Camelimonas lactis]TCO14223.1 hypothetical protein EV666_104176 [Camelimonas lactis]
MSDIFREIDEDLRRDRAADLARRYGGVAAVVALVVILGVGGWRFMEYRASQQAADAGVAFEQAVKQLRDGGDAAAGVRALEAIAGQSAGGYRTLARFRLASQKAATDKAAAIAAFDALAADSSLDPALRDMARIRAATIDVDMASPEAIVKRLEGLAAPNHVWRNQARELIGLAWMKAGKLEEAGRWFAQVAVDGEAPQSLRRRAQLFMELAAAGPVIAAAAPAADSPSLFNAPQPQLTPARPSGGPAPR